MSMSAGRQRMRLAGALAATLLLAACAGGEASPSAGGHAPGSMSTAAARPTTGAAAVEARQPALLAAALAAVAPQRQGRADLYFVGFAGDAAEDVFLHEAQSARALIDRRFGSAGRSLLLANNEATVDSLPLASIGNLSRALAGIGGKMNREEDVLFLFLTSHGSPGGWLSTEFEPFRPRAIVARQIDAALDDAGIKWRVIVISACFSGAFIEPLADENSLIITAARADRASFGCGHDGPFTYFGDAYFGRVLPASWSFTEAFEQTKRQVAEWERARNFQPSEPQIRVGSAIGAKLAEIEAAARAGVAAN
jgi:hypothetical protein